MPRHEPRHVRPSSALPVRWLTVGSLLVASPAAHALLIGQPAASPVLGQALRASVPLQLGPGEQIGLDCVQAQIAQGDQTLPGGQVVLSVQALSPSSARVEVRSRVPITEPYVVLTLKLGCQFQRSQQFTMLVDPPAPVLASGGAAGASPSAGAQTGGAGAASAATAPSVSTAPGASALSANAEPANAQSTHGQPVNAQPGGTAPAAPPVRRRPVAEHRRSHPRHVAEAARERHPHHPAAVAESRHRAEAPKPAASAGSRLHLDWMAPDASPLLSLSTSMHPASAPVTDALRQKAASLRDAVMGGASAPASTDDQLARLAAQVAALEADRARDSARIAEIRRQAERAEAQADGRVAPVWAWVLGALAAALAGLSAWLWRDRRRMAAQQPWFESSPVDPAAGRGAGLAAAGRRPAVPVTAEPDTGPDTIPVEEPELVEEIPAPEPAPVPAPAAAPRPLRPGHNPVLDREAFSRPLSGQEQVQVDEMMDIGHLADFFIGIGNDDQAIDVMRKALAERSGGLLALPYLYLFDLYRKTGRRADYEELLVDFAHRFNVRIPAWDDQPQTEPRDLEAYPRAMSLICETWGQGSMVTVIERMLLDDPTKPRVGFDLPAYRDLLDLYAVAREILRAASAAQAELSRPPAAEPEEGGVDVPLQLDVPAVPDEGAVSAAARQPEAAVPPAAADPAPAPAAAPQETDLGLPPLEFTLEGRAPRPRGDEDATFRLPESGT